MTRVAVVDCGSNSVRLLVAEHDPAARAGSHADGAIVTLDRDMRITRLGKGVDATGHLDDQALQRTLDVVGAYARRWRELGASRAMICATSAIRDAWDRDRFFDGVHERTGEPAVVLTGEQEARTSFLGATAGLDEPGPYLVVDIGGGSTEVILGHREPTAMTSRQLGCVRLTERCLHSDPPTDAECAAATAVVDAELDALAAEVDLTGARTLIGVAGTVTTLAGLHLGLETYDADAIHGTRLPLDAAQRLTRQLAGVPSAIRARSAVIAPGREDVLVAGAMILTGVMARFGFEEVLVSEADILDGLALTLLAASTRTGERRC